MKKKTKFTGSTIFALVWLGFSITLAIPWVRDISVALPAWYAAGVIIGIALLPGYLMTAMFISNCLNTGVVKKACGGGGPVCVIICARNERDCIYETIQSVARQKYPDEIRILCVDNGSEDGTSQEIERAKRDFENENIKITLLVCETAGKANALNTAFNFVNTRYFLTVDADTILLEDSLCAIVGRISHCGAACVAGNVLVSEPRTWVQKMQIYDYLVSIAAVKRYQGSYGATLVAQGAFSAYDTEAVREIGGWTQGAGEDIVLTYKLLGEGRLSLYEPCAVAYTRVPATLRALCRQRIRWARGMLEGFRAVAPWQQPTFSGGYFESLNLSIIFLDLTYVFGFLAGVGFALFGQYWFVGWQTLTLLPLMLVNVGAVIRFQQKLNVPLAQSAVGFINFILIFQVLQSICSLIGYTKAIFNKKIIWK